MERVTLKNYRCFREEQTARLAPLTLLVGENSTGKTSFMAMIRVLWEIAAEFRVPDFKELPYDLGSFDEIAHHRGSRGRRSENFQAGFSTTINHQIGSEINNEAYNLNVIFGKLGATPVPIARYSSIGNAWVDGRFVKDNTYLIRIGTNRGAWKIQDDSIARTDYDTNHLINISGLIQRVLLNASLEGRRLESLNGSPEATDEDLNLAIRSNSVFSWPSRQRPFASAPVRSRPQRTYDPSRVISDPEGYYSPMYLANIFFRNRSAWNNLKELIEYFGKESGLFDEISIKPLGRKDSDPFQVQIRKFGDRLKGPRRNLIDVGYGVSQVLPVITELLRPESSSMFLLQQPEVHLHPSAQAALGSLFCLVAGAGRQQIVVETHSDHLLDRVRMDVRDGDSQLKPEDVSILFFERDELDVRIHSLDIDGHGNIIGAPASYRRFFMDETRKSLGL